MSVPIMDQAYRILNALEEGSILTVMRLYDTGIIGSDPSKTRKENILNILTNKGRGLGMSPESATEWLDQFKVK